MGTLLILDIRTVKDQPRDFSSAVIHVKLFVTRFNLHFFRLNELLYNPRDTAVIGASFFIHAITLQRNLLSSTHAASPCVHFALVSELLRSSGDNTRSLQTNAHVGIYQSQNLSGVSSDKADQRILLPLIDRFRLLLSVRLCNVGYTLDSHNPLLLVSATLV